MTGVIITCPSDVMKNVAVRDRVVRWKTASHDLDYQSLYTVNRDHSINNKDINKVMVPQIKLGILSNQMQIPDMLIKSSYLQNKQTTHDQTAA